MSYSLIFARTQTS